MTRFLVTSASGANGDGYGAVVSFTIDGEFTGPFSHDDRISDPRGICLHPINALIYLNSGADRILALDREGDVVLDSGRIAALDPGGAIFGPDGRLYVGLRRRRTILAVPSSLDHDGTTLLSEGVVPYPRGFAFGSEGELYVSSGIGPSGGGDNTIALFSKNGMPIESRLVHDPDLSPLDLTIAPNGHLLVTSECPFNAPNANVTVREYHPSTGDLVRVFSPHPSIGFAKPRGLRIGSAGTLYCVGKDHIVAFDLSTGSFLGVVAQLLGLNGQAIVEVP